MPFFGYGKQSKMDMINISSNLVLDKQKTNILWSALGIANVQ